MDDVPVYCSFVSTHYIICECGDNFPSEEALKEHLEKEHKNTKNEKPIRTGLASPVKLGPKKVIIITKDNLRQEAVVIENPQINDDYIKQEIIYETPQINEDDIKQEIIYESQEEEDCDYIITHTEVRDEILHFEYHEADETVEEVSAEEVNFQVTFKEELLEDQPVILDQENDEHDYVRETRPIVDNFLYCEVCGKTFTSHRSMNLHITRMHTKTSKEERLREQRKNAVCDVCGKNYASNAALRYHQRVHTGEKPYKCTMCPKAFTMPLFLQIHTRTHTGERPYECPHCPKAFSNKAALLRHDRVHTGIKPYPCPYCGKTFTQSNSMKLHVQTVHLKMPAPYKSAARRLRSLRRQLMENDGNKRQKQTSKGTEDSRLKLHIMENDTRYVVEEVEYEDDPNYALC